MVINSQQGFKALGTLNNPPAVKLPFSRPQQEVPNTEYRGYTLLDGQRSFSPKFGESFSGQRSFPQNLGKTSLSTNLGIISLAREVFSPSLGKTFVAREVFP